MKIKQIVNINQLPRVPQKKMPLKDVLREIYLKKNTFDAPGLKNWSFSIEGSYVNLALINKPISHEENPEYGLADEKEAQQLLIPLEKLFTPSAEETKNGITIEKILILGRAGIGKSTLCHYIAYQWANPNKGLLAIKFDYVFWVSLKTLDTESNKIDAKLTASKFLYNTYLSGKYGESPTREELQEVHSAIYGNRCLILLDGYDEVTHLYTSHEHNARVLKELLDLPHIILTSRPTQMNATLENKFDRRMENRGFTDDNIKQYVHKIFPEKIKTLRFMGFLQENPSIYGIAYIPLNLFLLCDLWGEEKNADLKNVTLTKLYQNFFRAFLKKRAITCKIFGEDQNPTKSQLELKFLSELNVLSELAFRHFYPKVELIISFSSIERILSEKDISDITVEHLRDLGFIKPTRPQDSQTDYYFIHKTFQEFFAAYYLFNALKNHPKDSPIFKEAMDFIEYQKYYPAYAIVFWFLLGLLHDEKAVKALSYVMDALLTTSKDWIGLQHIILMIHILEQTEFDQTIPQETQNKIVEEIEDWVRVSILDNQNKTPKSLPAQLSQSLILCPKVAHTTLSFFQKNWDKFSLTEKTKALDLYLTPIASILPKGAVLLISLLEQSHQNQEFMEKALSIMPWQRLNYSKEREQFIVWLKAKLNDDAQSDSDKIRISALKALVLLKTDDKSFILCIEKLTTSQDTWISLYAEIALISLKDKSILDNTDATFEEIIKLLESKDITKASKALEACEFFILFMTGLQKEKLIETLFSMLRNAEGTLSEKAANLLDKFGQSNLEVQQGLWSALKPVEEPTPAAQSQNKKLSLNERRIMIFQKNLTHKENAVKVAAANSLILMGIIIKVPEIITALVKALGDWNSNVRVQAASALVQLGQESPKVIDALIKALKDLYSDVRVQAASALGNLKQATPEVIYALIKAVGDLNSDVRTQAVSALGNLKPEIIGTLIKALRDSSYSNVGTQTASALGDLKQETPEVIDALIKALRDNVEEVRTQAASALGNLKQATPEVIDALVEALVDKHKDVRAQAASALGNLKQATTKVIKALIKALEDLYSDVRTKAASALGNLKQTTPEVIDALIKALRDSYSNVREKSASALGNISELEKEHFLALIDFIENSKNEFINSDIIVALRKIKIKVVELNPDNFTFILDDLFSNNPNEKQKALNNIQKFYRKSQAYFFEIALQTMYSYPKITNSIITLFSNIKCNSIPLFLAYKEWINRDLENLIWTENLWLPLVCLVLQEGSSLTYPDQGILVLQGSDGRQEWRLPYGERNHLLLTLMSALKKEVENLKLPVHFYDEFFGVKSARYLKRSSCIFHLPVLRSAEYPAKFNPKIIVDREHWTLSFIRKGDDPHVFIIIEGMTASGKAILQRIDLTTTGASKGKAKIVFLNAEELKKSTPNIEINISSEGAIISIEKMDEVIESKFVAKQPCYGFVWPITRSQFGALMKNITEDQKQGERGFSQYGDQSFFSSKEKSDNCFTWSCRHLKALNHNLINRDLKATGDDKIAADPRRYLTACLIHQPPEKKWFTL